MSFIIRYAQLRTRTRRDVIRRLLVRPTVRSRHFGLLGKGCPKLAVEATTSTRFCSPAPEAPVYQGSEPTGALLH